MTLYYSLWYILVFLSSQYVSGTSLSSLTFVIDDTSSMGDDIDSVKRGATGIFDTVKNSKESQIDNFVLVTFNDHSFSSTCTDRGILRVKTKDEAEFKAALARVSVDGGAEDCEECAMEGIIRGLEESLQRSSVYVFTDATAKDYERFEEVKRLALEKQCQIVFVLTGLCSQPTTSPKYKVYEAAAKATGGQVFHIDKHSVDKVLEFVKMTIKGRMYPVNSTTLSPGTNEITINADALMGEVLFSIASDVRNDPSVTIKGPDGSDVWKKIIFSTEKNKVYAFSATSPGTHIIQIRSTAEARAVISAKSGVDFEHGFSSIKLDSLLDSSAMPAPDAKTHLMIKLTEGDIALKSVKFLDINDNVISELPLEITNNATKFYTTEEFDPPSVPFKIAIIGYHAESASNITRMPPTTFERRRILPGETINNRHPSVVIDGEAKVSANYNEPLTLTCKVEGYPKPNIVWKNLNKGTVISSKTLPGTTYPYDHVNVLSIERVTENAKYSCEANNPSGSDSKEVAVEVIGVPATIDPPIQLNKTLIVDQKLSTLPCKAAGVPEPEIKWTYQSFDASEPSREMIEYKGETLLKLENIQLTHKGYYTCGASNFAGSSEITYSVNVFVPATIDLPIQLNKTLIVDQKLSTLSCKAAGVPEPEIKWTYQSFDASEPSREMIEYKGETLLKLENIQLTHKGYYTCGASNFAGSSEITYSVNVFVPATIDPPIQLNKTLIVDQKLSTLSCKAAGVPEPEIKWTYQSFDASEPSREIIEYRGETLLKLENIQLTHEGHYTCIASNFAGTSEITYNVNVFVPATINPPKQLNKALVVDQKLSTLSCRATGVPEPEIKWTYQSFNTSEPSREIIEYRGETLLKLENIQLTHEGHYTCIASNFAGSSEITYIVNVFEGPRIDRSIETEASVTMGKPAKFECKILNGKPKPSITWYFRLREGYKDAPENFDEVPEWKDKESVELKRAYKRNSGTYQCQAKNDISTDYLNIHLLVEYRPKILNKRKKKEFMRAKAGVEVSIPCYVDGSPPPSVTWFKDNVELVDDGETYTFGPYNLKFVPQLSHKGYYTCNATNKLGSDSKTVKVDVTVPATILIPRQRSYTLPVGSDVTLPCKSRGDPKPNIKWTYRRFGDRKPSKEKKIRYALDNSLDLKHIQVSEEGYYTCIAMNTGGSMNVTYEIQVFAPVAIVNTYKEKRFVAVEGDLALQINCNATGSPKPTITWTKDGSDLTLGSTYFVEEGTLFITEVPAEATGFYTCEAQNPRSIDQETYEVVVEKYPLLRRAAYTLSIKEGQSEEIKCPLPYTDIDQLRWFKNGVLIYDGELLLTDASVSDSGFYSCRVSTLTKSYSRGVEVFVGYGPKFKTIENVNVIMAEGWPVSLNCESDSRPEGHVTWYHDGKKLDLTDAIYYFPAGISSPGQYSCEVSNTYGNIARTFHATQEYCVVKPSILVKMNKFAPLMMSSNNTWLDPEKSHGNMVFPKGLQIHFYCPNGFTEFTDKYITGFCDSGPNFLIDGEKYDYSDIKCTEEIKHIVQKTGIQCMPGYVGENTEKVNVGYKQFDYAETVVYEVCINKTSETPIFAKNIMRNSLADDEFDTTWSDNDQFEMDFEQAYKCRNQIEFISDTLEKWFHNDDECCFSKRQLVSPRDVFPGAPQRATYSYYNAVPHWSTCNVQNWNKVEQTVRNFAKKIDSELLVWTGTAQELSLSRNSGTSANIYISDRSSKQQIVPLFLWKVIQNPVSMASLAIIQVNVPDLSPADVSKYILCKDQCDRIEWIKSSDWHDVRKGYIYCCRLEDFESAFGFRGVFEPDMNFLPLFAPF